MQILAQCPGQTHPCARRSATCHWICTHADRVDCSLEPSSRCTFRLDNLSKLLIQQLSSGCTYDTSEVFRSKPGFGFVSNHYHRALRPALEHFDIFDGRVWTILFSSEHHDDRYLLLSRASSASIHSTYTLDILDRDMADCTCIQGSLQVVVETAGATNSGQSW